MVLWVLMLLSVIVAEFSYSMRTEILIARNFKEQTEARYAAIAGINMAVAGLVDKAVYPYKYAQDFTGDADGGKPMQWRINTMNPEISIGNGSCDIWIDNESGKINLNGASPTLLRFLFQQFDLQESELDVIVDSILDWRDDDHLYRLNGAEDDYYNSLPDPYECKDGPFESLDELAFVKGIPSEMITSDFKKLVTVFVPPSPFDKDELNKKTRAAYLLREKKAKYKGPDYSFIDINAASKALLLIVPGMTTEDADSILEYRKKKDISRIADLQGLMPDETMTEMQRYFATGLSTYYTLRSVGYAEDRRIRASITAFVEINTKLDKKYRFLSMHGM